MAEILRHKKTGGLYEVLFRGAVIHSDVPLSDDAPVTVCRRLPDGQIVARFGPTPRGTFDVLHHSRLQTDALLHDGSAVTVYRATGGGPVWARRTVEMDDGRFEPVVAPPSGSCGEVEGLSRKRPVPPVGGGIYTASKTRHADKWKILRAEGWPIASTWIDEAGAGETACFTDLWRRCVWEASQADALLLYREPEDVLKGALVKIGAALSNGVPVYAIGCEEFTFAKAAGWVACASIEEALERIQAQLTTPLTITIAPGETTAFAKAVSDGICGGLPIRDEPHSPGVNKMVSAWMPTPEEVALIAAGAPIYLAVIGVSHPPVALFVGNPPADSEEPPHDPR